MIEWSMQSAATGPECGEAQGVDTAELSKWADVVGERFVHTLAVMPPVVVLGACWAQGFMAGVAAARRAEAEGS